MIFIFIIFGLILFLINKNKFSINVTIFLILFPFFGLIANNLEPFSSTRLTSIFYDFVFILPLYLFLFTKKLDQGFFGMMETNLKFSFFFIFIIILLQFLNPYNPLSFLGKLVGLKVWLFYFLMTPVGYYYIQNKNQLIYICKLLSKISIIPISLAIVQFFLVFRIGFYETMNLFYTPEVAKAVTQGFTKFSIASNIELIRIPSTFSYSTQFSNYLLFSFIPVLTCLNYSKDFKNKIFYTSIFFLIIIASIASGVRGMYIYIPIFFIYYLVAGRQMDKLILYGSLIIILCILIYNFQFANIDLLFADIKRLTNIYTSNAFKDGFSYLFNNFFGNGVGTATYQTTNITGLQVQVGPNYNEGYFFKVITELGFIGLVAIMLFYLNIIKTLYNCLNFEKEKTFKVLISSFIAFYVLMITINIKSMHIDLFPSNILIFLFLGMILKINQINQNTRPS
jgi:hypothetical protein